MRTFTLVNGNGEEYSITSKESFFHDPKGLGYGRSNTYRQIGNRWVLVKTLPTQNSITGSLLLLGASPYDQYNQFLEFCGGESLVLKYQTTNIIYSRDVILSKVEKTEIDKDWHGLDLDLTFTCMSLWTRTLTTTNKQSVQKVFWPIAWPITWGQNSPMSMTVQSTSHQNSPSLLTINGPFSDPSWRHYVNGVLYETGAVHCTIPEGAMLLVDNRFGDESMKVVTTDGTLIQDVYPLSDFSTKRFINIQYGANTIIVQSASANFVTVKLEVKITYESV